jgi:hypothetical protein
MVQAFDSQRAANPVGAKTVGPFAGQKTVYHLGRGHDHRGATWHDAIDKVVWLCAYRRHRSGEADDAFPYFHSLIAAGRIYPTEEDYELLIQQRSERFVDTLYDDAQALLARARANPGAEEVGVLGGEEATGVLVEVVETLEETYVAFSVSHMDDARLVLILEAFYPDAAFSNWEFVAQFPARPLRENDGEICCRILR